MTIFKISFLLAFSTISNAKKTGKKIKDGKKSKNDTKSRKSNSKSSKSKSKSTKSSKTARSKKKEYMKSKSVKEVVVPPKYVLDVGKPIGYAHIEYELIAGKNQKQQIDVVCWKGVAKVFAAEDTLIYRVRMTENTVWVPIFIEVLASQMSVQQLEGFHKQEIYFQIYTKKSKLGSRAKAENTKLFYLKEEDVSLTDLAVPAYVNNPNLLAEDNPVSSTIQFFQNIITECLYRPTTDAELVCRLRMSDLVQKARMNKIIEKISNNEEVCCKDFIPIALPPSPGVMQKNEGSEVKSSKQKQHKSVTTKLPRKMKEQRKNKKRDVLQIKVSAEVFFTDPIVSIYDVKEPNDIISNAYVLLSVDRLMTNSQKFLMNPMIVKVDKIENLDVEGLKQKKFKSIFIRYCIPDLAEVKTLERDIATKVRFNEAHALFTHNISKLTITEFLQSNRLFLEICGVRELITHPEIRSSIFGSEHGDKHLGRRMTPTQNILYEQNKLKMLYPTVEVLAVACYDLTSLLNPVWNYTSNESCHHPNNLLYQQQKPFTLRLDPITTNNINIKEIFPRKSNSPLSELSLLENGTSLKVEVYFLAPATEITNAIYYRYNCYNRMLMVVYSSNIAASILNEILKHNQLYMVHEIIVPDLNKVDDQSLLDELSQYVSGFVIDDGETCAFFLEGIYQYKIGALWKKYKDSAPSEMTIYFNSDCVFKYRLYTAFSDLCGLCVITLQKPLRDILAQDAFYVEGNVPLPCWQAVKKLDILFRATTLKDMLQYNLLPTPEELLSLSMEWGVPMRWKDNQADTVL